MDQERIYLSLNIDQIKVFNEFKEKTGLKGGELAILLLSSIPELSKILESRTDTIKEKLILEEIHTNRKIESNLRTYFMDLCKLAKTGISKEIISTQLDRLVQLLTIYERKFSKNGIITSYELLNNLTDLKNLIEDDFETFKNRAEKINFTLGIFEMAKLLLADKQDMEFKKLQNETRKSIGNN